MSGRPKLDGARKAWLERLQNGEEVAVVDDAGNLLAVGAVTRRVHRNEFSVASSGCFTLKLGKGSRGHREANGHAWMIPLTAERKAAHDKRRSANKARERIGSIDRWNGWRDFSDDQVLAVAAILWPETASGGAPHA